MEASALGSREPAPSQLLSSPAWGRCLLSALSGMSDYSMTLLPRAPQNLGAELWEGHISGWERKKNIYRRRLFPLAQR